MITAIYIGSCIFEIVLLYLYFRNFFVERKTYINIIFFAIAYVAFCVCTSITFFKLDNANINLLITVLGTFALSFLYKGSMLRKILSVLLYQVLAMAAEIVTHVIFVVLRHENPAIEIQLIASKMVMLLLVMIVGIVYRKKGQVPRRYMFALLFVPLFSIIIIDGLIQTDYNLVLVVALISVLVLNIVIYVVLDMIYALLLDISKRSQMDRQIESQKDKYEQLSASFRYGNRLLHDVNKHLRFLENSLENNRVEEAIQYLKKTDDSIQENYNMVQSGNLVIDSLLSSMERRLMENNVTCKCGVHVDNSQIHIEDYDLVVILGNILDNAMESVMAVEDIKARMVAADISSDERMLKIYVKNGNSSHKKHDKNDYFHGMGLDNIKDMVSKYGGTVSFESNDMWFETMVCIPMSEGHE